MIQKEAETTKKVMIIIFKMYESGDVQLIKLN